MSDAERFEAIRKHHERLVQVNRELGDRLTEARGRRDELTDDVDRLMRRNETLKTSSLYVATVEELVDGEAVIRQHGNNQEVLTDVEGRLAERIEAGDRVAVDDSFSVQRLLDDETDARAQAMEVEADPDVSYTDIGGIDEQIREVREAVEDPLDNPERFVKVGVEPPAGVLLHGPPGTGKTMLAKAVANETDATFIKMAGSELVRKFIGEGSRLVDLHRRDRRDRLEAHGLKNLRRRRGPAHDDAAALRDGRVRRTRRGADHGRDKSIRHAGRGNPPTWPVRPSH
jgi:proteasome regulatory subunit